MTDPHGIDPARVAAAVAAGWRPLLGRIGAEDAGTCTCGKIPHTAPYLARWERAGDRRDQLLCTNRAAAWAAACRDAGADVSFPPGAWRGEAVGRPPQVFPIPPGTPMATCSTCRAPIRWIETERGRRMPVDLDGVSHFVTCVDADQHRRPR